MTWISSVFLLGLTALAAPVVIHLLQAKKYEDLPIGSLRFLKEAEQLSRSSQRLKHWLLLLFRLLLFLLIVLAFCRPFFEEDKDEQESFASKETLVLMDVSGSMAAKTLGVERFELAKKRLEQIIDEDKFGELKFWAYADKVQEFNSLKDLKLKPAGSSDLTLALTKAREHFSDVEGKKRIIVISDLQKNSIPKKPWSDWPLDLPVTFEKLSVSELDNIAIQSAESNIEFSNVEGKIEVGISRFGNFDPKQKPSLNLFIDGKEVTQTEVQSTGDNYDILWTPERAGIYHAEIKLSYNDAFDRDNVLPFKIKVREQKNIAIYTVNESDVDYFNREGYFLSQALKTNRNPEDLVDYKLIKKTYINDLSDIDVVALCNPDFLEVDEVDTLKSFVKEGGKLIYFMGDNSDMSFYRRLERHGLFVGQVSQSSLAVPRNIGKWDTNAKILQEFNNEQYADLKSLFFRDAFDISPNAQSKVLISLNNNSPLLLESTLDKGKIMALTNPVDRAWSDWPSHKLFIPFIHEIFSDLADVKQGGNLFAVEEARLGEKLFPGAHGERFIRSALSESDLKPADAEKLYSRLALPQYKELEKDKEQKWQVPSDSWREKELYFYCLLAALLLLLLENVLADRRQVD